MSLPEEIEPLCVESPRECWLAVLFIFLPIFVVLASSVAILEPVERTDQRHDNRPRVVLQRVRTALNKSIRKMWLDFSFR